MSQPQINMGGPVGTPNSGGVGMDPAGSTKRLNTAIYDYLLRLGLYEAARQFVKSVDIDEKMKDSPNQRGGQQNGIDDGMGVEHEGIANRPHDLPAPAQLGDGPFLQDWWCQFWEIYHGHRGKGKQTTLSYIGAQRQMQKARTTTMMDAGAMNMRGQFSNGSIMPNVNGMNPDALKRAAMANRSNL